MLVHTNSTRDSYKQCLQYKAMFRFKQSLSKIMVKKSRFVQRIRPTNTVCSCNKKKEHLTCFSPYTTVRADFFLFLTGFKSSIVHFLLKETWVVFHCDIFMVRKWKWDTTNIFFYIFLVGYRVDDGYITPYIFRENYMPHS